MAKVPPKLDEFTQNQHTIEALFVNHVGMNAYPDGVRITFNESPNGTKEAAQPRAAVYLPLKTAEAFLSMLMQVVGTKVN